MTGIATLGETKLDVDARFACAFVFRNNVRKSSYHGELKQSGLRIGYVTSGCKLSVVSPKLKGDCTTQFFT